MASTYLTRTQTSGDRKKFTISFWFKLAKADSTRMSFISADNSNDGNELTYCRVDDIIWIRESHSNVPDFMLETNAVFRDVNAWYHIVFSFDSTQATSTDRLKMYVNGVEETSFSTSVYPSLNYESRFNENGNLMSIGRLSSTYNYYYDGSMAHFHFIDGTAYDADTFGETDATTGIWKPKTAPSVTYGTNGFFLKFENSGAFGTDSSGNSNTFTVNGTMTQTIDTPSNVFATLNTLNSTLTNSTLTNGNLQFAGGRQDANYAFTSGTIAPSQGKWYWEVKAVDNAEIDQVGVAKMDLAQFANISNSGGLQATTYGGKGVQFSNGNKVGDGSQSAYMGGFSANDILMVALNLDSGSIYFGRNGQWSDGAGNANQTFANAVAAYTNLTVGDAYVPAHCMRDFGGSNPGESEYNFGNGYFGTTAVSSAQNPDDGIGIFEYAVPTGYKALCTKSINAQEYD